MSTALERADGKPTVRQLIEQMKPEIQRALPAHLDADRIARIAITVVGTTPALARCTPESFLGALMTASQLGLEPGPLGEAYLVPYGDKVTFIPGYRGLIKLAYQSGQLRRIAAHVVRANDDFDFAYGLEPYLHHKPKLGDRGEPIGAYAAAALINGESPFVVMSVSEVDRIRRRSRAADKGPWVTDWDAMARKTAVRQLARWLPMSTDLREFGLAVGLDGSVRTDPVSRVDEVPYEEAPQLGPAASVVTPEDIRPPDPPPADQHRGWHDGGHAVDSDGGPRRSAFEAGCPICAAGDDAEAGRIHYYNHTVDFVDDCHWCQQDLTWRQAGTEAGGSP